MTLLCLIGNQVDYVLQSTRIQKLNAQSYLAPPFCPAQAMIHKPLMVVFLEGHCHLPSTDAVTCLVKTSYANKPSLPDVNKIVHRIDDSISEAFEQTMWRHSSFSSEGS